MLIPYICLRLSVMLTDLQETQAIDDLAAYVTSITAEPQFTSVVAALAQAVPTSVLSRLEEAPESYILELATGTAPSIFTALPTGVYEYFASVGEQALSILEQDTGLTNIPANLIPTGVSPASIPAYATGGYYYPTGVIPTGYAYPSGFATGATGASGSAGLRPTQNITSYNGQNASPTPVSFTGAAAPRKGAFGVAAAMAGVAMFFACR